MSNREKLIYAVVLTAALAVSLYGLFGLLGRH